MLTLFLSEKFYRGHKVQKENIKTYKSNEKLIKYFGSKYEMRRKLMAIVIGNLIFSFGVNAFYTTHKFLSGGIGGISVMLQYITGIAAGISVFFLNLPLFLFGLRTLSKKFLTYAFISTIIQSITMIIFKEVGNFITFKDPMLSAIAGGIINGTAMGILFKNGCCQGGFDIVAAVMKKKYNMQIGSALLLLNAVVISIASYLFGVDKGAYTIIAMFISYNVLDKIQMSKGNLKSVTIISGKSEEIRQAINLRMSRGVTALKSVGGWSKKEGQVLYLYVERSEISILKSIINKIDSDAFIGISDVEEIRGRGFRGADIE